MEIAHGLKKSSARVWYSVSFRRGCGILWTCDILRNLQCSYGSFEFCVFDHFYFVAKVSLGRNPPTVPLLRFSPFSSVPVHAYSSTLHRVSAPSSSYVYLIPTTSRSRPLTRSDISILLCLYEANPRTSQEPVLSFLFEPSFTLLLSIVVSPSSLFLSSLALFFFSLLVWSWFAWDSYFPSPFPFWCCLLLPSSPFLRLPDSYALDSLLH